MNFGVGWRVRSREIQAASSGTSCAIGKNNLYSVDFVGFIVCVCQLPSVLPFAMENVLAASENSALCTDIRKEMKEISRRQNKATDWTEKKTLQTEFRQLRKELKQREKKAREKERSPF